MIRIGHRPILWHIMQTYSFFGFRRFILCLGFKAEVIKEYFLNYTSMHSDFTVNLNDNEPVIHSINHKEDWEVTLAYTGQNTMTGARLARAAEKYIGDAPHAAVTYGDGVCNANLLAEYEYHCLHNKKGTVLGVNPPSRFGEIKLDGDEVIEFDEKPEFSEKWINGGYFFFQRDFFTDYLSQEPDCILEKEPLVNLARDGELNIHKHTGFWSCMDTLRDYQNLNALWTKKSAPWSLNALKTTHSTMSYHQ